MKSAIMDRYGHVWTWDVKRGLYSSYFPPPIGLAWSHLEAIRDGSATEGLRAQLQRGRRR